MDLTINGEKAEFSLEQEETLGDLLRAVESYLDSNGFCLQGFSVDGKPIDLSDAPEAFKKKIASTGAMNIIAVPVSYLLREAIKATLGLLSRLDAGEEAGDISAEWEQSPASVFMAREAPELQEALAGALSADRDIEQCAAFFAERLEELTRPGEVFSSLEGDVGECCACLENLSLDLQTGKNAQAAKTVERFSLLSEKIFRLLKLPELKEFIPETVNGEKFSAFFEGFGGILQEILGAWQNQDTVLLGDLAEYEVAPRLRAFYEAVKDNLDQN